MPDACPMPEYAPVSRILRMHYASGAMNALESLLTRSSAPRLEGPEPAPEQLDKICRAALRAADHAMLRPWRFLIVRGESRERLGGLFVEAALASNPDMNSREQERLRAKTLRAPLIIVVVASHVEHPKVPAIEQDLSAGAAAQNMLNAAFAQGVGAMWRTGSMAYDPHVMKGMGLAVNEKIIGFLYLGAIIGGARSPRSEDPAEYFREW